MFSLIIIEHTLVCNITTAILAAFFGTLLVVASIASGKTKATNRADTNQRMKENFEETVGKPLITA